MSKSVRKLQIKLLSQSGELLNCINCFAGQVSVFRATTNSELFPYLRALSGTTGPERFVVELDGQTFMPQEHTLIGFGERFLGDEGNVSDFLISHGIPQFGIDSLLLTYGLEKVVHTKCHLLSRCEERRLRIIAATYSDRGVLIAQEPFDPISSEWREKFAEIIVNFARQHKQIVVIPSLSYRPQYWIDNDIVARIQVGENIQKTIGFGGDAANVQTLVNQMREIFKDQKAADEFMRRSGGFVAPQLLQSQTEQKTTILEPIASKPLPMSESTNFLEEQEEDQPGDLTKIIIKPRRKYWSPKIGVFLERLEQHGVSPRLVSISALSLLIIIFGSFWQILSSKEPITETFSGIDHGAATGSNNSQSDILPVPVSNNESIQQATTPIEKLAEVVQSELPMPNQVQQTSTNKAFILAAYPAPIYDSVVQTFEGANGSLTATNIKSIQADKQPPPSKETSEASDFLRLLKYAESSGESNSESSNSYSEISQPTNHDISPFAEDNMDEQQRREAIRQKFLEAIQRAQERRAESGE